jgi:hypothetical protein
VSIGNEDNLAKVRALMDQAQEIGLGSKKQGELPIDFVSEEGNQYTGLIVVKRPNTMDYMKMGAIKADILRQNGVTDLKLIDDGVKFMAQMLATFQVVIVKCPTWFLKPEAIEEVEILYHVYAKYELWLDSFRKLRAPELTGDSQASVPAENVVPSEALR